MTTSSNKKGSREEKKWSFCVIFLVSHLPLVVEYDFGDRSGYKEDRQRNEGAEEEMERERARERER